MDRRCETCKWWENNAIHIWGACRLTRNDADSPASKALAPDKSGDMVVLKTAPDFGCVQWEGKDK